MVRLAVAEFDQLIKNMVVAMILQLEVVQGLQSSEVAPFQAPSSQLDLIHIVGHRAKRPATPESQRPAKQGAGVGWRDVALRERLVDQSFEAAKVDSVRVEVQPDVSPSGQGVVGDDSPQLAEIPTTERPAVVF